MVNMKQTIDANRTAAAKESDATHAMLEEVLSRLGHPANGPNQPSSGVYWAIDAVSTRLRPFELWWERMKGAALVAAPCGVVVWFLAGDKVSHLFHG